MKKNPIGKYLLQNWYYYVFAFGSMALSVFLDMLAPLVTLHIVDDVLVGHKMELLWKIPCRLSSDPVPQKPCFSTSKNFYSMSAASASPAR